MQPLAAEMEIFDDCSRCLLNRDDVVRNFFYYQPREELNEDR
jgi:hypothetical protein